MNKSYTILYKTKLKYRFNQKIYSYMSYSNVSTQYHQEYHDTDVSSYQSRYNIEILYNDPYMIIFNKPTNMLSVPGKEVIALHSIQPRKIQWNTTLHKLYEYYIKKCTLNNSNINENNNDINNSIISNNINNSITNHNDSYDFINNIIHRNSTISSEKHLEYSIIIKDTLQLLIQKQEQIPKKEIRFYSYLKRACKVADVELQQIIWKQLGM